MHKWSERAAVLILGGAIAMLPTYAALCQPIPDRTLGNERSRVEVDGSGNFEIRGGARRSANLFHSFREFSIQPGDAVYLINPSNAIRNILTRVTGNQPSQIRGTLGVRNAAGVTGNPTLFLLNPNGILLGRGARLDIAGSFVASTADSLQFRDLGHFSATDPRVPGRLLTIEPSAFWFNAEPQPIRVTGATLAVGAGESLLLVGGDVSLNNAQFNASEGALSLTGLSGEGNIRLIRQGDRLSLNVPLEAAIANVTTANSRIFVNPPDDAAGTGGTIQIAASRINLENTYLVSASYVQGNGGDVILQGRDAIALRDSFIYTNTVQGNAGGVQLSAGSIHLTNTNVFLGTVEGGAGDAGTAILRARHSVSLIDSNLNANSGAVGNAGRVFIQAGRDVDLQASGIDSITRDQAGGNIRIDAAGAIALLEGSALTTQTQGSGRAGDIVLNAGEDILIQGNGRVDSSSVLQSSGAAGAIAMRAENLTLADHSVLSTVIGQGAGGNIQLHIADGLLLRHGSRITAGADVRAELGEVAAGSSGGNIGIRAGVVAAVPGEDSDIVANAVTGQGGNITIATRGILGLAERRAIPGNGTNDLDASSQFGVSGTVIITSLAADPSQGLAQLPSEVIDASQQVAQECSNRGAIALKPGALWVTGRGGLPPQPHDLLGREAVLTDWAELGSEATSPSIARVQELEYHESEYSQSGEQASTQDPITEPSREEAQGWLVNARGQITLVAQMPTVPSGIPVASNPHCPR